MPSWFSHRSGARRIPLGLRARPRPMGGPGVPDAVENEKRGEGGRVRGPPSVGMLDDGPRSCAPAPSGNHFLGLFMAMYPFCVTPDTGDPADRDSARDVMDTCTEDGLMLDLAEVLLRHDNPHVRMEALSRIASMGASRKDSEARERAAELFRATTQAAERERQRKGLLWTPVMTVAWREGRVLSEEQGKISWDRVSEEISEWVAAQRTPAPLIRLAGEGLELFRDLIGTNARVFDRSLVGALYVDFLSNQAWITEMAAERQGSATLLANPELSDDLLDYVWSETLSALETHGEWSWTPPPPVVMARRAVGALAQGARPPSGELASRLIQLAVDHRDAFIAEHILACRDWPQASLRNLLARFSGDLSGHAVSRAIDNPNVTPETIRALMPHATSQLPRKAMSRYPWMLRLPEVQDNLLRSRGGTTLLRAALCAPTPELRRAFVDRFISSAPKSALQEFLRTREEETTLILTEEQSSRLLGLPDSETRRLAISALDRVQVESLEDAPDLDRAC